MTKISIRFYNDRDGVRATWDKKKAQSLFPENLWEEMKREMRNPQMITIYPEMEDKTTHIEEHTEEQKER